MPDNRGKLVGLVANPRVAGYSDPAARADRAQPFLVRAIRSEVSRVAFDLEPALHKGRRKCIAEIAVGEEDEAQAACS